MLKRIERSLRRYVPRRWREYSRVERVMLRARPIATIVHVGAHFAEDAAFYESLGARTVLWIEADPDTYATLQQVLGARTGGTRHIAHLGLVSAEPGQEMRFFRFSGDGSSSSVHQSTDIYRERFPDSRETGESLTLRSQTLPDILAQHAIDPAAARAMLVLDVQGHELAVLHGIGEVLRRFDLCKCEVSRRPFYAGGAQFKDINAHLHAQGFTLASPHPLLVPRHGDVIYTQQGNRAEGRH